MNAKYDIPYSQCLSAGAAATLACLYEATAAKPGNVHPAASFDDATTYAHFVTSAVVIGPFVERAAARGVGQSVLDAVRATRELVGTNTNLGTLLLITPLAAVESERRLPDGIQSVLAQLSKDDTRLVYEAIRVSGAGGLGRTQHADVFAEVPPDLGLVEAMRLAAERDLVARQYINGFADVFRVAEWIADATERCLPLGDAIVHTHVRQLAASPDSLIARKCGHSVALAASAQAASLLAAGKPGDAAYRRGLEQLDQWLRADGHRRNPGTTADLIAAALFVLLRDARLHWKRW